MIKFSVDRKQSQPFTYFVICRNKLGVTDDSEKATQQIKKKTREPKGNTYHKFLRGEMGGWMTT